MDCSAFKGRQLNNKLSKALIIGGSSMDEQTKVLDRGVDVLIATPGSVATSETTSGSN